MSSGEMVWCNLEGIKVFVVARIVLNHPMIQSDEFITDEFPLDRLVLKAWLQTMTTTGGLMAGFGTTLNTQRRTNDRSTLSRLVRPSRPPHQHRSKL